MTWGGRGRALGMAALALPICIERRIFFLFWGIWAGPGAASPTEGSARESTPALHPALRRTEDGTLLLPLPPSLPGCGCHAGRSTGHTQLLQLTALAELSANDRRRLPAMGVSLPGLAARAASADIPWSGRPAQLSPVHPQANEIINC